MDTLDEGVDLPNGMKAKLLVGKPKDASPLWDAVKDVREQFFTDDDEVADRASFARWFERGVDYCCIGLIEGDIVGCAYLVALRPGEVGTFHAFASPEFRTPKVTAPLAKRSLEHFIDRFGLKRLETVGRMDNRNARMLAAKLGFVDTKRLTRHEVHGNSFVDYYCKEITVV